MTAVHQYMYFHFHCDDQGYDLLAGLFKKTAIEEMLHIERIAERILFLKGEVEMKASAEVEKVHVQQTLIQFPKNYLKTWWWTKNDITINSIRSWKILKNLAKVI